MKTAISLSVVLAAAMTLSARGAGEKKLVVGDVPPHTVGAYRPFRIPGEIEVSDGFTELRKGRDITVWCPAKVAQEQPKKLAAAQRFVDSPFLPVLSRSVGYFGGNGGEAVLKGLGVKYRTVPPNDIWKLAGNQVMVLGPGTGALVGEKQTAVLKKQLASRLLVVLPGADLSLLPVGLSRKEEEVQADVPAILPALPLFAGAEKDFAEFVRLSKGAKLPVMDKGPAWMLTSSPACFAHVKSGDRSIVVVNVAPQDAPEAARPALTRVLCTVLANINVETGEGAEAAK